MSLLYFPKKRTRSYAAVLNVLAEAIRVPAYLKDYAHTIVASLLKAMPLSTKR
jgi:hypothetical protein